MAWRRCGFPKDAVRPRTDQLRAWGGGGGGGGGGGSFVVERTDGLGTAGRRKGSHNPTEKSGRKNLAVKAPAGGRGSLGSGSKNRKFPDKHASGGSHIEIRSTATSVQRPTISFW